MADESAPPDSSDKAREGMGAAAGRGSYPGTPRWVKVLGIIALVVVVLVVILLLTSGDVGHGPGRH